MEGRATGGERELARSRFSRFQPFLAAAGSRGCPVTFSFYSAVLFSVPISLPFFGPRGPSGPYAPAPGCHKIDFRRVWHRQSQLASATAEQFHGLTPQMEDKSFYASHRETMSSTRKFVLTAFVFIIPLKIQSDYLYAFSASRGFKSRH